MERQFDKQKTNVAKGVAVLILLVHHIFYNYARGLEFPNMKFLNHTTKLTSKEHLKKFQIWNTQDFSNGWETEKAVFPVM